MDRNSRAGLGLLLQRASGRLRKRIADMRDGGRNGVPRKIDSLADLDAISETEWKMLRSCGAATVNELRRLLDESLTDFPIVDPAAQTRTGIGNQLAATMTIGERFTMAAMQGLCAKMDLDDDEEEMNDAECKRLAQIAAVCAEETLGWLEEVKRMEAEDKAKEAEKLVDGIACKEH